jgi:hypothetical protein
VKKLFEVSFLSKLDHSLFGLTRGNKVVEYFGTIRVKMRFLGHSED